MKSNDTHYKLQVHEPVSTHRPSRVAVSWKDVKLIPQESIIMPNFDDAIEEAMYYQLNNPDAWVRICDKDGEEMVLFNPIVRHKRK